MSSETFWSDYRKLLAIHFLGIHLISSTVRLLLYHCSSGHCEHITSIFIAFTSVAAFALLLLQFLLLFVCLCYGNVFFFSLLLLLLLHHAAALSTSTTHPLCAHCAAHSVNSHCCLCSSCDCYFLSTCAKLNNKSFGLKRKQNQSERKIAKATILTKIKKEKRNRKAFAELLRRGGGWWTYFMSKICEHKNWILKWNAKWKSHETARGYVVEGTLIGRRVREIKRN